MKKKWRMLFGTMVIIFTFCLSMLVISGTALAQQCTNNGDGTVTDNNTGLMWQKATAAPRDWNRAMSYADGLSLGGHSDWRLPNRDELKSLYNSQCKSQLDVKHSNYWSSTTLAGYTDGAWLVHFYCGCGNSDYKSTNNYVRAVRDAR